MKDFQFARTVWANKELVKASPNKDLNKFVKKMTEGNIDEQLDAIQTFMMIMNKAYVKKAKYENLEENPVELTQEDIDNMDTDEFMELVGKASETFFEEGKESVGAEPKKEEAEEHPSN